MIIIENLTKKYRNKVNDAVNDLSLTINDGEIFGFLGHNGAGKSTTIKCITGILPFEKGRILINGHDISTDSINAKKEMGYVSDEHAFYENMTGLEYIYFMGNMYGVLPENMKNRASKYINLFRMDEAIKQPIKTYSFGLKQKANIIATLVVNPKVWILDEPLLGIDLDATHILINCMLEMKAEGHIVLFSSHNIDVLEKICDTVAIIKGSKLVDLIDMKKFRKKKEISLEDYFMQINSK